MSLSVDTPLTLQGLIEQALRTINSFQYGDSVSPDDSRAGKDAAQEMLDAWRADGRTLYQLTAANYALDPGRGGADDPYTIGPGGDFDQMRPRWIPRGVLLIGEDADNPDAVYELELLTDDAWGAVVAGEVTAAQPTSVYYRTDFTSTPAADGLGDILLYPIPNGEVDLFLRLYTPIPFVRFANFSASYLFPPGYAEAMRYQLAMRLALVLGFPADDALKARADASLLMLAPPAQRMPLLRGGLLATNLIAKAYRLCGILRPGDQMLPAQAEAGYEALNDMLDGWAAQRLTIYETRRKVYPLVAGKGAPSTPYTIGPGGDFDQARPLWITNAELVNLTTTPSFETPLNILRDDPYARTSIKALASSLATDLYYNYRFDTTGDDVGLGEIFLYPVPNGQIPLQLALYVPQALVAFEDLNTTQYTFPPGYAEALRYQLALRLAIENNRQISPELDMQARKTFGVIQRPNVRMPVLRVDRGMAGMAGGSMYNWRTGENSGPRG